MFRRLATVTLCVSFTFIPSGLHRPTETNALKAVAAATPETKMPSAPAARAPDPREHAQAAMLDATGIVPSPTSSLEAAIGAEFDAKLFIDHDKLDRWPLTRGAMCQVIREVSAENRIPEPLFTRLIWQESRFRHDAVSPAGAQGIAQFMPATAAERGLEDPFDPLQAIPASAEFLAELLRRFGNFGLAAAAYNGGPTRVSRWLAGLGGLPQETRNYVVLITGRTAEQWAEAAEGGEPHPEAFAVSNCEVRPMRAALAEVERQRNLRAEALRAETVRAEENKPSPLRMLWTAVLSSNWSDKQARTTYAKLQKKYPKVLADREPKIKVAKAAGKGKATRTIVGVPALTRAEAQEVCNRLKESGGACVVQKDPA